jgi:hypothetical protein
LAVDAQSTDQKNDCQATREQEAQNVVLFHLAWSAVLRNRPIEKRWIKRNCEAYHLEYITIKFVAFTLKLSVHSYAFARFEAYVISGSVVTERPLFDSRYLQEFFSS